MRKEKEYRTGLPKKIDIDIACDGDLITKWENADNKTKSPRVNISVAEAILSAASKIPEAKDSDPDS